MEELLTLKTETCDKEPSHAEQGRDCIADLHARLGKYAADNAVLAEKLEACENENRRLRFQNEELIQQLTRLSEGKGEQEKDHRQLIQSTGDSNLNEVTEVNVLNYSSNLDLETSNRLLSALEDAPLHMSYCDSQLRYIWFNHTLKGLSRDEVVGKRDEDLFPLDSEGIREFIDLRRRALESGRIQTAEIGLDLPENGRMTWMVTARPHVNQDDVVVGISTASMDITEQVEVNECLSKLRADMAAQKATEDELRKAVQVTEEAIHAKNVFLAIMSHEIRTPLNGLIGLAEALDSFDLNEEQRELVSAILSSGVIISDILGDILDLASTEFGVLELEERPFDPSEIVQDIMKMALAATRGKDVVVSSEILSNPPRRVIGDAVRVRQIMKYLVLNAIKFTERGSVRIRLRVEDSSRIIQEGNNNSAGLESIGLRSQESLLEHLRLQDGDTETTMMENVQDPAAQQRKDTANKSALSENENSNPGQVMLYCEVVDTGVGIPRKAFPTLFEKFKQVSEGPTRSYGGTGLGLAICKRLVEFMGGELTVSSEVGKGSTFSFTVICKKMDDSSNENNAIDNKLTDDINKSPDKTAKSDRESAQENVDEDKIHEENAVTLKPTMRPRILLAEDNKVNVMVAISMLKRLGFSAKVVANGVEALEAIRKEKYDLVLLDVCMPLMDGLQVAYAIRRFEQTGEWPEELFHHRSGAQNSGGAARDAVTAVAESRSPVAAAPRLPIVAVTANALRSDVDRCFAHGMDAFIAKPVMFRKLQEIIHRYLPPASSSSSSSTPHMSPAPPSSSPAAASASRTCLPPSR